MFSLSLVRRACAPIRVPSHGFFCIFFLFTSFFTALCLRYVTCLFCFCTSSFLTSLCLILCVHLCRLIFFIYVSVSESLFLSFFPPRVSYPFVPLILCLCFATITSLSLFPFFLFKHYFPVSFYVLISPLFMSFFSPIPLSFCLSFFFLTPSFSRSISIGSPLLFQRRSVHH